jgi:hypothetical protein
MRTPLVAWLVVLLMTPSLRAEDARLPFSPFEKARPGDFAVYSMMERTGTDRTEKPFLTGTEGWTVGAVTSDAVSVEHVARYGTRLLKDKNETPSFSPKQAPTLRELLSLEFDPKDVTTKDEERAVAGRRFKCTKVSFKGPNVEGALWLSRAVSGPGIVASEALIDEHGKKTRIDVELMGYGSADRTEMGSFGELWKVPVNPYAHAKVGDWCTFVVRSKEKKEKPDTETWRIEALDGTKVTVATSGPKQVYDTSRTPTLHELFRMNGELTDLEEKDEKRTVAGRAFACKLLAFTCKRGHVTLWMSEDVKAGALVGIRIEKGADLIELELAGYGDSSGTKWGKTEAELK